MQRKKCSRDEFPELLSGGESQRLAGLTPGLWAELFESQRLPRPVDVAGRLKWRKSDIVEWIANLEPAQVAQAATINPPEVTS